MTTALLSIASGLVCGLIGYGIGRQSAARAILKVVSIEAWRRDHPIQKVEP